MSDLIQIHFRVTEEMYEEIKFQMDFLCCTTMVAYLRYMISNNTLFRIDVVGLNRMSDELQAIGSNINQIAYKVNKFGSLRIDQLRELQDEIEKMENNVVNVEHENESILNGLNNDNCDSFVATIGGCRFFVEVHFNQNTNMTLREKRRKISNAAYEIPKLTNENGGVI